MATSTNMISALGAGSGVDVKALAESLVDAERAPLKERLDAKVTKTEAKISGFAALKYSLSQLQSAFEKLNDANDFGTPKATNSQPAAFMATPSSTASTGSYSVEVSQLAHAQRSASAGFAALDTPLNNGQAFSLSLAVNAGPAQSIPVSTPTPEGMVKAINASGTGLSAKLIRTGDGAAPYAVVVSGQEGASKSFTLGSNVSGVSFGTVLAQASDAVLKVDGLQVTRSSNTISDVIPNVTLNLMATTAGAARLDLNRDAEAVKANIKALVSAYNDFDQSLNILGDSKSQVETLGGSLAGDRVLQNVRNQVRSLLVATSSTPGATITAARDVGLSLDRKGRMTLDEDRLDAALETRFDEVTKMFSAGTNNKSVYSTQPAGLAGDFVATLDKLQRSTGIVAQQTETATKDVAKYKEQLKKLETRMEKLLERYTNQFSLMESVVGKSNSLKTSLTSSFEALMANAKG